MLITVAAGRVFEFGYSLGMEAAVGGGDAIGFPVPVEFAIGPDNLLYVMCRGTGEGVRQRVVICTPNHEQVGHIGEPGDGDGQMRWPTSIDLDSDGNVYTADEWLNRISIFEKDGTFLGKWGKPGSGDGELDRPSGIAFDQEDNLYVVDSLNHRVQKFTRDGKLLLKWGRQGSDDGEFNMPWGICVDSVGDVYVADWKNSRVQKFSPDGRFLTKFEKDDAGVGEVHRPTGIAVDSDGDVYITDWLKNRLQVFDHDGVFITSLYGDALHSSPWAQAVWDSNPDYTQVRKRMNAPEQEKWFLRPVAVNVDAEDRIFVLENGRHRFQIYNKVKDFEESRLNL